MALIVIERSEIAEGYLLHLCCAKAVRFGRLRPNESAFQAEKKPQKLGLFHRGFTDNFVTRYIISSAINCHFVWLFEPVQKRHGLLFCFTEKKAVFLFYPLITIRILVACANWNSFPKDSLIGLF